MGQHGAIEDSLIAMVTAKEAMQEVKAFACRMPQQIGTEKCIPAVAGLLTDDVLSHYARLVLQRTGNPKADAAMRDALDSAPDKVKVGLMGSLGARRDEQAFKQISKLTASTDPAVATSRLFMALAMGSLRPWYSIRGVTRSASMGWRAAARWVLR